MDTFEDGFFLISQLNDGIFGSEVWINSDQLASSHFLTGSLLLVQIAKIGF
jgi:hypothetical protein